MFKIKSLLVAGLTCLMFPALPAQNVNVAFRSKLTFPGQTLANVWGYTSRDGKEYALVGGSLGMLIIDVSNPDNPQQIVQIPGPNNLWKEIKTYSNYAYITSEGGGGIQVVNLKDLPSANLQYHNYRGDGPILNQLNQIHALHIDVQKGFLYAWGGNLFSGGAKVFDLKPDPYNPKYVGKYDQLGYIHDGTVENDTMYSGHIYAGQFAIVNMSNKSAPELIATQQTPGAFTHNTWLTDDHKTLLTTDEVSNSFLTSFDISDPTDIQLLDKIQSNPGSNSVVHNTYVLKNWAVTSWYKDGITIVDVTRPDNMVQVGNFDTYPGSGSGFDGCWGVYPYFPSGTIIASNIRAQGINEGELFILTPNYQRACYLEGIITDKLTGLPLQNAKIEILGSNPFMQEVTTSNGKFKMGLAQTGYFQVKVSKNGYQPFQSTAYFTAGEVINLHIGLYPTGNFTVTGTVRDGLNANPVPNATIYMHGQQSIATTTADQNGQFAFYGVDPGIYDLFASAPGLGDATVQARFINADTEIDLALSQFYHKPAPETINIPEVRIGQNPFQLQTELFYTGLLKDTQLKIFNTQGQMIETHSLTAPEGTVTIGQRLPRGVYWLDLDDPAIPVTGIKLLKVE